jgi:hypothetical protein
MKCKTVRDKLGLGPQALELNERAAIDAHLQTCAACQQEMAAQAETDAALVVLAQLAPAPLTVEELRRHLAPVKQQSKTYHGRYIWAGAAALVLIAVGIALLFNNAKAPTTRNVATDPNPRVVITPKQTSQPQPQQAQTTTPRPVEPQKTVLVNYKPRRHHRSRRQALPAAPKQARAQIAKAARNIPVEQPAQENTGIILLYVAPEAPEPSSSYYAEVSRPGAISIVGQDIERDADGQPTAITISYAQNVTDDSLNKGG